MKIGNSHLFITFDRHSVVFIVAGRMPQKFGAALDRMKLSINHINYIIEWERHLFMDEVS